MRTKLIGTIVVLLVLASSASIIADTEWDINGQVRLRTEADKKSFHPDARFQDISLLRTRIGVSATLSPQAKLFAQLQDSRVLGEISDNGPTSGTLTSADRVDLHQAYFVMTDVLVTVSTLTCMLLSWGLKSQKSPSELRGPNISLEHRLSGFMV